METVRPFLHYLNRFIDLSEEEFRQYLHPIIQVRKFGKREIVTPEGEVENYFNFIVKGLARKYYRKIRDSQEEINVQIATEGQIIFSQESFHNRTPSEFIVETIEPTVFVSILYTDLERLFSQSQKMEHMGRMVVSDMMINQGRRQMQLIKQTPRERFIDFVTNNPELMQRVPQKYLASYLNIKPETFSRFKHMVRGHHAKKISSAHK
jgi:CRP-like cAMP-binding protein